MTLESPHACTALMTLSASPSVMPRSWKLALHTDNNVSVACRCMSLEGA